MEKQILVTIITVCYNSEKTIARTIESVLNQTYDNIEYIIVDGKSKDHTMKIIQEYEEKAHDKLTVICEEDNGIYDAMNKGIAHANGEIIGIINSDDFYEADAVEKILGVYKKQKYAVFYGNMRTLDQDGKEVGISFSDHKNLEKEMIAHPTCFVTKATYDKLGGFDTKYSYVADYDLMLRFKKANLVQFVPVDAILANFTMGGVSSSLNAFFDLLDMQVNHGLIRKRDACLQKMKAIISKYIVEKIY